MEQLSKDLWRLEIPLVGSPLKTLNSYLILGAERSLLIDTGLIFFLPTFTATTPVLPRNFYRRADRFISAVQTVPAYAKRSTIIPGGGCMPLMSAKGFRKRKRTASGTRTLLKLPLPRTGVLRLWRMATRFFTADIRCNVF